MAAAGGRRFLARRARLGADPLASEANKGGRRIVSRGRGLAAAGERRFLARRARLGADPLASEARKVARAFWSRGGLAAGI